MHQHNPILTFDWNDELWDDREDPLWAALGQEIFDPVDGQEDVGVRRLPEAVEQEGKVVVVVQRVNGNLQMKLSEIDKKIKEQEKVH